MRAPTQTEVGTTVRVYTVARLAEEDQFSALDDTNRPFKVDQVSLLGTTTSVVDVSGFGIKVDGSESVLRRSAKAHLSDLNIAVANKILASHRVRLSDALLDFDERHRVSESEVQAIREADIEKRRNKAAR